MKSPPLFDEEPREDGASPKISLRQRRRRIQTELEAGAHPLFVWRCVKKHGGKAGICVALTWLLPLVLFFMFAFPRIRGWAESVVQSAWNQWWTTGAPGGLRFGWAKGYLDSPITIKGATVLVVLLLLGYLLGLGTYMLMRRLAAFWDKGFYRKYAGPEYSLTWEKVRGGTPSSESPKRPPT